MKTILCPSTGEIRCSTSRHAGSEHIAAEDAAFRTVAARFRREDLNDPVQVKNVIRCAMEELLQQECVRIGASDRARIVEWMQQDPVLLDLVLKNLKEVIR